MDPTDFDTSLAEMFDSQVSMTHGQAILDLPTNEVEIQDQISLILLIKPFGFKPPPLKSVIPRLLQAWNIKKGVTITPKKYTNDILICLFKDKRDMLYVEKDRVWSDSETLPKCYVTPRALVKVPITQPLYPGLLIRRKNSVATWVFFKYEHLKTFCYDCGTIGHNQAHCTSEAPVTLDLYGPWLQFDLQADLLPPQLAKEPTATPSSPMPKPISATYKPEFETPT
ncbi:hypothetical protein CRG98_039642 [Punica granatum]|uniref:CCHC-type domain-containing protein n=1 Tax=Punica granatum TaxID=22663 RepID=A0A2I0I7J7_PUNGR|nr:hypothetical protein CRG98_039642 [Punica granatum]